MSDNNDNLVIQPIAIDEVIDLTDRDDRRWAINSAAQSLQEDKDLSPIAYLSTSLPDIESRRAVTARGEALLKLPAGKALFLFTLKDKTDLNRLADLFKFRGALETVHDVFRKGYRVIVTPDSEDTFSVSGVKGEHRDSYVLDGVTYRKDSDYGVLSRVSRETMAPNCGHFPAWCIVMEIIQCDDGPNKAGNPVCSLCHECAKAYGTGNEQERELVKKIGEAALVPCFMFVPFEDIEKLPGTVHITLGKA
jgi:hypothetical protein